MDGTPWGYIQQKKKTEEALSHSRSLEQENVELKGIIKKLLKKKPLDDSDKKFLGETGVLRSEE
ncbi:MAG: hypothetical protein PHG85_00135 [Candidatus Altiarchaeota archaeon]|nr:hypothetical protein [Candidatus Altiarchaeota archaeon]